MLMCLIKIEECKLWGDLRQKEISFEKWNGTVICLPSFIHDNLAACPIKSRRFLLALN